MTRFKILIEFDGTDYAGWQRQTNAPSIQASLEQAINDFCRENVTIYGAGRTDAGVHGRAMAAHFDLERPATPERVRDALNFHLREQPISVLSANLVEDDFHARFSCLARHYEYRILNRRAPASLTRAFCWWVPVSLDYEKMHEAAQFLVGTHDFTTFRATMCQSNSPVKSINAVDVRAEGEFILITCNALSFLHNQVRSIVGSLVEVGKGRWAVQDLKSVLDAKDRTACGPVAPACGLYFVKADYP